MEGPAAWNEAGDVLALGGPSATVLDVTGDAAPALAVARQVAVGRRKLDEVAELAAFAGRWRGAEGVAEEYRWFVGAPNARPCPA